jgi:hypothetical protein
MVRLPELSAASAWDPDGNSIWVALDLPQAQASRPSNRQAGQWQELTMAEDEGFEPSVSFPTHDFQDCERVFKPGQTGT